MVCKYNLPISANESCWRLMIGYKALEAAQEIFWTGNNIIRYAIVIRVESAVCTKAAGWQRGAHRSVARRGAVGLPVTGNGRRAHDPRTRACRVGPPVVLVRVRLVAGSVEVRRIRITVTVLPHVLGDVQQPVAVGVAVIPVWINDQCRAIPNDAGPAAWIEIEFDLPAVWQ